MAFEQHERAVLLSSRGIGPAVIERLEQVGIDSLDKLQATGAEAASNAVCIKLGSLAWANRRRALEDVLASFGRGGGNCRPSGAGR